MHNYTTKYLNKKCLCKVTIEYSILVWSILFMFLSITGILVWLNSEAVVKEKGIRKIYEGKRLYTLIDNLYDSDDFYEFRQNADNLDRLGEFYNSLVNSKDIEFLSSFNQPICIENFKGNEAFYYNTQEFREEFNSDMSKVNVKSLQLNMSTFECFQLRISEGNNFDWSTIDYESNVIPVLLGADYKGEYEVGDTLTCNYYSRNVQLKVIGFLEPNTFINFKGDAEFYLDQYIIIPYPLYLKAIEDTDFKFEGILYFAMINGNIMTSIDQKSLLSEIKQISDTAGFSEFSIIGISDFTQKYDSMISSIKENQTLIIKTLVFLCILVLIIMFGIAHKIMLIRLPVYRLLWVVGINTYNKVFFKDICQPFVWAEVSSIIFIRICFQVISWKVVIAVTVIDLAILLFTYAICKKILRRYVVH